MPVRRLAGAAAGLAAFSFLVWLACPIGGLFDNSYSRAVFDCRRQLVRATLAPDEQLRFTPSASPLPRKYVAAVTTFEDRRYFLHPGVDPAALFSAAAANIRAGKRLRGGSTITMQTVRLAGGRRRTYLNKALECLVALKLTLHVPKERLLALYAAHVPMGGNTVGIESASYRYFGKPLDEMTWAQAALFAVLPKSPSMINLERGRLLLERRRNQLLRELLSQGTIDKLTCDLSCAEPLPPASGRLPFRAPHFAGYVLRSKSGSRIETTLDLSLQEQVETLLRYHYDTFARSGIRNFSAVVAHTATGEVGAYVGSHDFSDTTYGGRIDGVQARRSTGSLLKPLLAAKALDKGPYTMASRLHDVPTFYGSFTPRNASREFDGLVTLEEMLVKSLNVPAVRLLYTYGLQDFYDDLKRAGIGGLFRTAEGYGLSLILGGAESSLWDLTGVFAGFGNMGEPRPLRVESQRAGSRKGDLERICSPGAAWLVLDALTKLNRPGSEFYWHLFTEQVPVAWKTGTSYGQKDAWAIGVNAQWTIGIWVGNFTGETNTALGGAQSAGPILFALFNSLSDKSKELWFTKPEYDLRERDVCATSGYDPSPACPATQRVVQPSGAWVHQQCPFHRRVLTSRSTAWAVCSRCWSLSDTVWSTIVSYPPSVQAILHEKGFPVREPPRHDPSCPVAHRADDIELVYPVPDIQIIVPRNMKGEYERVVLKARCSSNDRPLFWYLDGSFIGETTAPHNIPVLLTNGKHRLVIEDAEGSSLSVAFSSFRQEE